MKVTFLDPCDQDFATNQVNGPLGLAYIGGYLNNYFDGEVDVSIEVDINHVLKHKPDIVGISAYTQTFQNSIKAAERIKKEANIPVIIGGKHITALPSNLRDCFDVGIVGDGEITSAKLIESYIKHGKFLPEELSNIEGIVFKDNNDFHVTPQRAALRYLDDLPKPKRDIMHAYWPKLKRQWHWPQGIYTSRGCPYKCPFCIHSKLKFVSRFHSAQRVLEEIQDIMRVNPEQKLICIYDDLFALRKDRLREIVELIDSEKINRKVCFNAMCKSNHFDEETAYLLKKMNVRLVTFGFESGDEKTLQYLKKDSSKVSENLEAINLCNKYGIRCGGYFIIGSPPETKSGLNKTYWFIRNNFPPMNMIGVYCLTPFPATSNWDNALDKGLVSEDYDNWDSFNYLKYDSNVNFFMNDNYDYDFFKNIHQEYFYDLYDKYKVFLQNDQLEFEFEYYQTMYKVFSKLDIKKDKKTLEITNNFVKNFNDYFNKEVNLFDNWSFNLPKQKKENYISEKLSNNKYDLILFNHSLEQMKDPIGKLDFFVKNHLNSKGEIIILLKNSASFLNFFNLHKELTNNKIAGFKTFDELFLINYKKIVDSLSELNLSLIRISPIPIDMNQVKQLSAPILKMFSRYIKLDKFLETAHIYSFVIHLKSNA